MSLILNIDTATENAVISIARDGNVLQSLQNSIQKDHAAFLHTGIQQLLNNCNISLKDIDAIAVINGPGSYTGLRVGMASAKGLCFALNKPLITVSMLKVMAHAALPYADADYLLCPLLDARRMEAFFALYDKQLNIIMPPQATALHTDFLKETLQYNKVLFFGNAMAKWQKISDHSNAYFKNTPITPSSMGILSYNSFKINEFENLTYSEPVYLKEFYHSQK